tara:strand:- start:91 stop:330 length:240 start_codon:yes stop_codon:yes gene_type:complete
MLNEADVSPDDELLTEPDLSEEDVEGQEEQSVAANVAGVTTPLGTDATYPDSRVGHRKSPAEAAGDSFGGARPPKKTRK